MNKVLDSGEEVVTLVTARTVQNLLLRGGELVGGPTVTGQMTWTGGGLGGGVINSGATLTISGFSTKSLRRGTLSNHGTSLWTGCIVMDAESVFHNLAVATFDTRGCSISGSGYFNNASAFRMTVLFASVTFGPGVTFNNDGVLDVQSGNLRLEGRLLNYSAAAGTLSGGVHTIRGTFQFANANILTNAATVVLDGPNARIMDLTQPAPLDALRNLARIRTNASLTLSNGRSLTTAAETLTNDGTLTVNAGSTFQTRAFAQSPSGVVAGAGVLDIRGSLSWTGGTMSGTGRTAVSGDVTLTGPAVKILDGRRFQNNGLPAWVEGALGIRNRAVWENGGTFEVRTTAYRLFDGALPAFFTNVGTFRKLSGTGTTTLPVGFNVEFFGRVVVGEGTTLNLAGGGLGRGLWTIETGATVNVSAGWYELRDATVGGAGSFWVTGGNVTIQGIASDARVENLALAGGTIQVSPSRPLVVGQTLTMVAGQLAGDISLPPRSVFYWMGGTLRSGRIQVQPEAILTLFTDDPKILDGYTLLNDGTIHWNDPGEIVVRNGATLNIQARGAFEMFNNARLRSADGSDFIITNSGIFRKSVGTGETLLSGSIRLSNFPAGRIEVGSGTLHVASSFRNEGRVTVVFAAILRVAGTYTQAGGTYLNFGTLVADSYVQTQGWTDLNYGTLNANVDLVGGELTGSGYINGDARNAARIQVGRIEPIGFIEITGNYTQTPTGRLDMEVSASESDYLFVTGHATLAGTLNVALLGVEVPLIDSFFTLVRYMSRHTGCFDILNLPPLGKDRYFMPYCDDDLFGLWVQPT